MFCDKADWFMGHIERFCSALNKKLRLIPRGLFGTNVVFRVGFAEKYRLQLALQVGVQAHSRP